MDTVSEYKKEYQKLLLEPINENCIDKEYTIKFIRNIFDSVSVTRIWHYFKIMNDEICRNTIKSILLDLKKYTFELIVKIIGRGNEIKYYHCPICGNIVNHYEDSFCSTKCRHKHQSNIIQNKWDTGEFHHQDKIRLIAPENARKFAKSDKSKEAYKRLGKRVSYLHSIGLYRKTYEYCKVMHINHPEVLESRKKNMIKINQDLGKQRLKNGHNMTNSEYKFYNIIKEEWPDLVFNSFKFRNNDIKYIPDFLIEKENLIIELDGNYHSSIKELDEKRDKYFESIGFRTVRINTSDIEGLNDSEILSYVRSRVYDS